MTRGHDINKIRFFLKKEMFIEQIQQFLMSVPYRRTNTHAHICHFLLANYCSLTLHSRPTLQMKKPNLREAKGAVQHHRASRGRARPIRAGPPSPEPHWECYPAQHWAPLPRQQLPPAQSGWEPRSGPQRESGHSALDILQKAVKTFRLILDVSFSEPPSFLTVA